LEKFILIRDLITEIRTLRKEIGVEEKAITPIELRLNRGWDKTVEANSFVVERLARVSEIRLVDEITPGLSKHHTYGFDVAVIYEREIDVPAERERLTKEIAKLEKSVASADRQLTNPTYLEKAPAAVVDGLRKQAEENRQLLAKAKAALEALPPA